MNISEIIEESGLMTASETIIDFGKDAFGWLEVELTGKGGEEVELAIGEVIRDGRINRDPGGFRCFRKMNLILREGTHTYRFEIPPHVAPNPALPKCYPPEEAGGEIAPFRYAEIRTEGRAEVLGALAQHVQKRLLRLHRERAALAVERQVNRVVVFKHDVLSPVQNLLFVPYWPYSPVSTAP